jgi:hypothetical protein
MKERVLIGCADCVDPLNFLVSSEFVDDCWVLFVKNIFDPLVKAIFPITSKHDGTRFCCVGLMINHISVLLVKQTRCTKSRTKLLYFCAVTKLLRLSMTHSAMFDRPHVFISLINSGAHSKLSLLSKSYCFSGHFDKMSSSSKDILECYNTNCTNPDLIRREYFFKPVDKSKFYSQFIVHNISINRIFSSRKKR